VALATDEALDVVTRVYRYAGGGAVYRPSLFERSVRDLHTAAQHLMVSSSVYETYGKILLGMAEVNPMS